MPRIEIPDENETLETILSPNMIMKKLSGEIENLETLYIFYKRDEIEKKERLGDWDDKKETYLTFIPIAYLAKINGKIEEYKTDDINILLETTPAITFKTNMHRRILKTYPINMLEIQNKIEKVDDIEYYPSKTILYKAFKEFMEKLQ